VSSPFSVELPVRTADPIPTEARSRTSSG
jgi:hypothetical protein